MQDDKVTSKQNKIRIRQRNAGMTYRKWISVFLCVIFVCGLLAGCGNDKVQEEQNDNVSANTIPEDVVVHTDYGDLHYPDRWQEYVTIRQEQNGNTIAVTFETKSGEETYELFKVLIGDDSSEVVGSLTDDTGTQRNVYTVCIWCRCAYEKNKPQFAIKSNCKFRFRCIADLYA